VIDVSFSKKSVSVLGSVIENVKARNSKSDNTESFSKFKGADQIYHRILWDDELNKEEFEVGYEDRYLGTLEIPFKEFSQKTDIPAHRIRFFKKNGNIVWDRTSKFCVL
jgi:uncharacterized protein (UPF0248 family)